MSITHWAGYLPVLRQRVRRREFRSLFLFVTSRCNSVCRTCFYFDKLNSRDDLTDEQIDRISRSAPPFEKLWLSGGEPFLRDHLAEIVALFAERNGVRTLNLPTNGLLPDRIFRTVDRILALCPDLSIDLNFSLDGLANTHDAIRGVPGNFPRTLATIREAERRYGGVRRLRRNVVTVITRENYGELVALGLHLLENERADGHYFEIVRGQAPDPTLKALDARQVADLHSKLMPVHRLYARRLFSHLPRAARTFAGMYYLGNIRLHFDLHEKCFERPRPWPMPCTAGETSLVVDHNGAFRACELRGILGNLAEFHFDVRAALESECMRREREDIPRANCWCTHSCFIHDSSRFSPRVQLFEIPWAWLRQRFRRSSGLSLQEAGRFRALEIA
jgi:MoaA/NifB/PqqE/SkfB family radical SAM enzyme